MGDELEYLKAEIDDIAATVKRMFPNVDQRFALILYRDEGDHYVTRRVCIAGGLISDDGAVSLPDRPHRESAILTPHHTYQTMRSNI